MSSKKMFHRLKSAFASPKSPSTGQGPGSEEAAPDTAVDLSPNSGTASTKAFKQQHHKQPAEGQDAATIAAAGQTRPVKHTLSSLKLVSSNRTSSSSSASSTPADSDAGFPPSSPQHLTASVSTSSARTTPGSTYQHYQYGKRSPLSRSHSAFPALSCHTDARDPPILQHHQQQGAPSSSVAHGPRFPEEEEADSPLPTLSPEGPLSGSPLIRPGRRKTTKSTASLPTWLAPLNIGLPSRPFASERNKGQDGGNRSPQAQDTSLRRLASRKSVDAGSSLFLTSRKAFSKSMDDLTSYAFGKPSSPLATSHCHMDEPPNLGHREKVLRPGLIPSQSILGLNSSTPPSAGGPAPQAQPTKQLPRSLSVEAPTSLLPSRPSPIRAPSYFRKSSTPSIRLAASSSSPRSQPGPLSSPLALSSHRRSSSSSTVSTSQPSKALEHASPSTPNPQSRTAKRKTSKSSLESLNSLIQQSPLRRRSYHLTSASAAPQRESQVIHLEGILQRKTDYKQHRKTSSRSFPFYSFTSSTLQSSTSSGSPLSSPRLGSTASPALATDIDSLKGWTPFYAVIRGAKLYLYKIPPSNMQQIKSLFPVHRKNGDCLEAPPLSILLDCIKDGMSSTSSPVYSLSLASAAIHDLTQTTAGPVSRPNVFELQTEEGEVALLQSLDPSMQVEWLDKLQDVACHLEEKRRSVNVLHLIPAASPTILELAYREPAPPRNTEDAVFGVRLETLVAKEGGLIPKAIHSIFNMIEEHGLEEIGIYRVPGENRAVLAFKASLDAGKDLDTIVGSESIDVHCLASLAKMWFRELPEVIPMDFYHSFIRASNVEGYDERLYAIRDLVWQLPKPSFDLLKRLCHHLHLVSEHELENHMHPTNLAIVFAPTLLKPPESSESYGILMTNLGAAVKLTTSLISQQHWIFSYAEAETGQDLEDTIQECQSTSELSESSDTTHRHGLAF